MTASCPALPGAEKIKQFWYIFLCVHDSESGLKKQLEQVVPTLSGVWRPIMDSALTSKLMISIILLRYPAECRAEPACPLSSHVFRSPEIYQAGSAGHSIRKCSGGLPKWLKGPVLKTGRPGKGAQVRTLHPPP